MPLPTWPSQLPCPLRANYAWSKGAQHERTAFGGPVEDAVRIFSASRVTVPCNVICTPNQIATLRAWIKRYDPAVNWVLMPANLGEGVQNYEARVLADLPPVALVGKDNWSIPLDIEIRAKADGSDWDYSDEDAAIVLDGFLYIDDHILAG